MTEIAKMTEDQIVEILRGKGWAVQDEDGVVEAAKDVDLTRTRTDGYDSFRVYGWRSRPDVFFSPTCAGLRLNLSERTAVYYLYYGDPPTGVVPLQECDFEGAVEMDFEEAGEMPLRCLIEGHGGLDLVRADGFWKCDLLSVFPGEHFIRKYLTGAPFEPSGADACYYRVPAEVAGRLRELRLPLGLPGDDAHGRMASIVAALEEQGGAMAARPAKPIENMEDFRAFVGWRAVSEIPGAESVLDVLDGALEPLGKAYLVPVMHGDSGLGTGGKDHQPSYPSHRRRIYATIYSGEDADIAHSLDALYHSYDAALVALHDFYEAERWRHANGALVPDEVYGKDIRVDWYGPSMSARGTRSPNVFLYEDHFGELYIWREHAPSVLAGMKSRIGRATFAEDAARMLEGGVEDWNVDDWSALEDFLPWQLRSAYTGTDPSHIATYDGETDKVTLLAEASYAAVAYIGVDRYGYDRNGRPFPSSFPSWMDI